MHAIEAFPDMETGYVKYRALFFDVLFRLARDGFVVQPADSLDVIHDFFTEEWTRLAESYDPARGSAANLIYIAFVRFARQRCIRLQKWKCRLRDLADLANQVAETADPSPLDALVRSEEMELLREALSHLPQEERTALLDFFAPESRSERQLAGKYNMKRDRFHELLLNGFGQLVARLAERGSWSPSDREVALALWCEGWKPEEAAARLGQSVQEVRERRDRLKRLLARGLANRHKRSPAASPRAVAPDAPAP